MHEFNVYAEGTLVTSSTKFNRAAEAADHFYALGERVFIRVYDGSEETPYDYRPNAASHNSRTCGLCKAARRASRRG